MTQKSGFSNFCRAPRYVINPFAAAERVGAFCWLFRKIWHNPIQLSYYENTVSFFQYRNGSIIGTLLKFAGYLGFKHRFKSPSGRKNDGWYLTVVSLQTDLIQEVHISCTFIAVSCLKQLSNVKNLCHFSLWPTMCYADQIYAFNEHYRMLLLYYYYYCYFILLKYSILKNKNLYKNSDQHT